MHIPKDAIISITQPLRIALIGAPGSGKTTSCLSFPNRIWYDFDHKLPSNESSIPIWSAEYTDKLAKRTMSSWPPNRRDAFKKHLRENHSLFTEDQTLIIDSWTMLQNAHDCQTRLEEEHSEKPDMRTYYRRKIQYSAEICEMLEACKCNVIVTFHESIERDASGEPTGKLAPLMDGKFKDQLLGHFTDCWRQLCHPYERESNGRIKIVDGKKQVKHGWYWQLGSDELVNTNTNPNLGQIIREKKVTMVKANYNELKLLCQTT